MFNRKGIVLLHDNVRLNALGTGQKVTELVGWKIMSHSLYSPYVAPSDYNLFLSLYFICM